MSEKKSRWKAFRNLDRNTIKRIAPLSWINWGTPTDIYRGTGYRDGQKPPETGDLLIHSPWTDWYNLTWGLAPNQDMPKWRWMYRARPEIRRGVDVKVSLAFGRGFKIECEDDEELEVYANRLLNRLKITEKLQSAGTDMLVYGQGYFEKIRVTNGDKQEGETVEAKAEVTKKWSSFELDVDDPAEATKRLKRWVSDIGAVDSWLADRNTKVDLAETVTRQKKRYNSWLAGRFNAQAQKPDSKLKPEDGDLVGLKPLDPLWMRINQDAFGNNLGFVQWGLTPIPQSVIPEKIVFLRWMPKSWAFEGAYGTSLLMPVQRHISFLIQAEEDMKLWMHQYGKPTLVIYAGTQEKPYTGPQITSLNNKLAARGPTTDMTLPGDCKAEVLQAGTAQTVSTFDAWAKYNREKIYEAIGIPSVLMNLAEGSNRAVSDTEFQGFVAEERMLQDFVGEEFMKQLIEPELQRVFADKYGDGVLPVIKIVWPPVLQEDANKLMDRLVKAVGKPFISVNEARLEIGLKPLGDEYDELAEVSQPGFGQFSKGPEMSESGNTGNREEEQQKRDRDVSSK